MSESLLVEVADRSPWTGNYDHDWCFFCYAGQEGYGPKPWTGHSADCLWVQINQTLGREVSHLVVTGG